jgi:inhibitor of cysteine peptidase
MSMLGINGQKCSGHQSEANVVTLTKKDNGSKVNLRKRQRVIVRLESQPGTGYSWEIVKNDASKLKLERESSEPGEGAPGATEIQVFRFSALSAGSVDLEMHYRRSWEKDGNPADKFHIVLEIR